MKVGDLPSRKRSETKAYEELRDIARVFAIQDKIIVNCACRLLRCKRIIEGRVIVRCYDPAKGQPDQLLVEHVYATPIEGLPQEIVIPIPTVRTGVDVRPQGISISEHILTPVRGARERAPVLLRQQSDQTVKALQELGPRRISEPLAQPCAHNQNALLGSAGVNHRGLPALIVGHFIVRE